MIMGPSSRVGFALSMEARFLKGATAEPARYATEDVRTLVSLSFRGQGRENEIPGSHFRHGLARACNGTCCLFNGFLASFLYVYI